MYIFNILILCITIRYRYVLYCIVLYCDFSPIWSFYLETPIPSIPMESYPDFRSAAVAGVLYSYYWVSDRCHRPSYQVSENLEGGPIVFSAWHPAAAKNHPYRIRHGAAGRRYRMPIMRTDLGWRLRSYLTLVSPSRLLFPRTGWGRIGEKYLWAWVGGRGENRFPGRSMLRIHTRCLATGKRSVMG